MSINNMNQIFMICTSGTREKLQMAAMITSVAAATGVPVTVFLSMNALQFFVKDRNAVATTEGPFGELMQKSEGVPAFKDLFSMAVELGDARILPCSMAMDLLEIGEADLDPELGPPTGLTVFLSEAEGAQIMTF
jgi:peroxiredoxin family protein